MRTPRLKIELAKIRRNARMLVESLGKKGVSVAGVTKAALGSPEIASAMLEGGVTSLGDSRIENILRMREAGICATFLLLRTPSLRRVKDVIDHVDISFNTELGVIGALSKAAKANGKVHEIVLMVDLGDLREGILPEDLERVVAQTIILPGIALVGLGTNLACLGGVAPDQKNMDRLSGLAESVEQRFGVHLQIVSGGNSANLDWVTASSNIGRINQLRLGESILLGLETLHRNPIRGLATDAMELVAEVIESKRKPSVPSGDLRQNAFGAKPEFCDRGAVDHALLALGRQDVLVSGITPLRSGLEIIGASSDHLVLISKDKPLLLGEEVRFSLDYGALLAAMTSPFVEKVFEDQIPRLGLAQE